MPTLAATEESMRAYYAQRAGVYERVYHKPERQRDLRAMEASVAGAFGGRRVLEVACGTGWWTPHGARAATSWLATDLNPETLAVARAKAAMPRNVRFAMVDAYTFTELGDERFDAAFAGFWWSHIRRSRLAGWLTLLHQRLEPGARVVLLDNRYVEGSSTAIARRDDEGNTYQQRALPDGSAHEVLKNFPSRDEALAALGPRARDAQWLEHPHYWVLSYSLD